MTEICKNWSQWLKNTRFSYMDENQLAQTLNWLQAVKDVVLLNAEIKADDTVIDLGTGTGLLGFGALEKLNENGKIIFSDKFEDCLSECKNLIKTLEIQPNVDFIQTSCENIKLPSESVNKALMRSVLVHILDKQTSFNEIYRILKPKGIFSAFEPVIKSNTRYYELLSPEFISDYNDFQQAESELMSNINDPLTNFDENTIAKNMETAGFTDGSVDVQKTESTYTVNPNTVQNWFNSPPSPGTSTMKEKFMQYFDEQKVNNYIQEVNKYLTGKEITVSSNIILIKAIKS